MIMLGASESVQRVLYSSRIPLQSKHSDRNMKLQQLNTSQPDYGRVFVICMTQLPKKKQRFQYLESEYGVDFIGQCLIQLGINITGKHRLPSDLGTHVPPFTLIVRERIIDSPLTIKLAGLDTTPEDLRPAEFVKLMNSVSWNVHFVQ